MLTVVALFQTIRFNFEDAPEAFELVPEVRRVHTSIRLHISQTLSKTPKFLQNKRLGFNFRTTDRPPFTMLAYRFEFGCIQLFICEHFQLMIGHFFREQRRIRTI